MNENSTPETSFPEMHVYCATCNDSFFHTKPTFNPEKPNSTDIALDEFWQIECGWQSIPPEVSGLEGEFLCPSCGGPMALDSGKLWLGFKDGPRPPKPGTAEYEEYLPKTRPSADVDEIEPSKGDSLEAELNGIPQETDAKAEAEEAKRVKRRKIEERDARIIELREKKKLTFRVIAEQVGLTEKATGKRYQLLKKRTAKKTK